MNRMKYIIFTLCMFALPTFFWPPLGLEAYPCSHNDDLFVRSHDPNYRDYNRSVTTLELEKIHFILKTLATKSLTSLLKYRSDLKRAGEIIDTVHPLQFLLVIFTDEELKVYIHNIKKRGKWVWKEFIKGLKKSLQDEFRQSNLTPEMVEDFAGQLQLPLYLIEELIAQGRWEEFVKVLIIEIPREGDSGRYDQ